jgi:hypothetical protein
LYFVQATYAATSAAMTMRGTETAAAILPVAKEEAGTNDGSTEGPVLAGSAEAAATEAG